jgi:hypothetical protein
LYAVALAGLLMVSRSVPISIEEEAYHRASEDVQNVVKAVAWYGPRQLVEPGHQVALATFERRETFPLLLAAWSRLSLARLGVLDLTTATRLPWLLLGASGPALSCWLMGRSTGPVGGLVAAMTLMMIPAWRHSAVSPASWALVLAWWLVTLSVWVAPIRSWCRAGLVGAAIGFGATFHPASLGAVAIVLGWWWWRGGLAGWSKGRVTIPFEVVVSGFVAPLLVWVLNPALWRLSPAALIRWGLSFGFPPTGSGAALGWGSWWPALASLAVMWAAASAVGRLVSRGRAA